MTKKPVDSVPVPPSPAADPLLPPHLREDAPPACRCDVCGRKSWDEAERGRFCNMPQPSNRVCSGIMQAIAAINEALQEQRA